MLCSNQSIKMRWHPSNKKWYQSKGYTFTEMGDSFDVIPQDLPKGSHAKVGFICDYCGKRFDVDFHSYCVRNVNFGEYKCIKCYNKHMSDYSLQKRQDNIYDRILEICNKYGYECLTEKEQITDMNSTINYVCPVHGEQFRRAHLFVYGDHICPECNKVNKRLTSKEVKSRIESLGSILLNPEDYTGITVNNLKIICKSCGELFVTSYNSFMCTRDGEGQRCSNCTKKKSAGEYKVSEFLLKKGIRFIFQKTFKDCKDERLLPFDFYLPDYNSVIEYDGAQHFISVRFHSNDYEINKTDEEILSYVQAHDQIKNNFCEKHGIKLLRINYRDYGKIEDIISCFLNLHDDIV